MLGSLSAPIAPLAARRSGLSVARACGPGDWRTASSRRQSRASAEWPKYPRQPDSAIRGHELSVGHCVDLMRCRHRLSKLLLRHGIRFDDGTAWTERPRQWLSTIVLQWPAAQATLLDVRGAIDALAVRRDSLQREIIDLLPSCCRTCKAPVRLQVVPFRGSRSQRCATRALTTFELLR